MKSVKYILIIVITVILQSCYQEAEVQVQNNISNIKIVQVEWGNVYIASELLPGETSTKAIIRKDEAKLPESNRVSFKMKTENQTIYLETEEAYMIEQGDDVLIILSDSTKVHNPN